MEYWGNILKYVYNQKICLIKFHARFISSIILYFGLLADAEQLSCFHVVGKYKVSLGVVLPSISNMKVSYVTITSPV